MLKIQINEIVNKFLLTGAKLMAAFEIGFMPGFTYSASESFTKSKEHKNLKKR